MEKNNFHCRTRLSLASKANTGHAVRCMEFRNFLTPDTFVWCRNRIIFDTWQTLNSLGRCKGREYARCFQTAKHILGNEQGIFHSRVVANARGHKQKWRKSADYPAQLHWVWEIVHSGKLHRWNFFSMGKFFLWRLMKLLIKKLNSRFFSFSRVFSLKFTLGDKNPVQMLTPLWTFICQDVLDCHQTFIRWRPGSSRNWNTLKCQTAPACKRCETLDCRPNWKFSVHPRTELNGLL